MIKLLYFIILLQQALGGINEYYCGNKNCYKVLEVEKTATQEEIKKAFRSLSRKYHPDKNRDKDTTKLFTEINQAYEVLSKPEIRASYDEYTENPNQNEYYHYYRFYKAKYGPQTDPKIVFVTVIAIFSFFQYLIKKSMYEKAVRYVENTTKFKTLLKERMQEDKERDKEEILEELRQTIQIEGGWKKPKFKELLIVSIVLLPYTILKFLYFNARWIIKFNIKKQEYGPSEREYLTKKALGFREDYWNDQPQEVKDEFIGRELWKAENLRKFRKEKEEEQKERLYGTAKYKKYMRFMKNHKS